MKKIRLDSFLAQKGFFQSRELAKKAILAGDILVDNLSDLKPGKMISEDFDVNRITVKKKPRFVSRGGLKLEEGLKVFNFPVKDLNFLDIGASTGGFTDCLLQNEANKVCAIDVGYGQFDLGLRKNPKVKLLERTNFRNLEEIDQLYDGSVMDVSFISILKMLKNIKKFTKIGAKNIWLIKPQFEAGKDLIGKGGIIKDKNVHELVLKNTIEAIYNAGFDVLDLASSPIKGQKGNQEFLVLTQNIDQVNPKDWGKKIKQLVYG